MSALPGAFPGSQGQVGGRRASDKPLNRRVVEMNSRDPDGFLQSWELVKPDTPEGSANTANGAGAGRKRKQNPAAAALNDSDSSLTPVSEDDAEMEADAVQEPEPPRRNLRNANAQKKPRAPASPEKARGRRAPVKAPKGIVKRGRVGAAPIRDDAADDADVDMEVENAPPAPRVRRQPARGVASPKRAGAA